MSKPGLILIMIVLSGCASEKTLPGGTSLSDGTTAYTVKCEDGWVQCHTLASRICGEGGYDEIDRVVDGSVSSAGRLERMHSIEGGIENHTYSESPRAEVFGRVMTVRCKTP